MALLGRGYLNNSNTYKRQSVVANIIKIYLYKILIMLKEIHEY